MHARGSGRRRSCSTFAQGAASLAAGTIHGETDRCFIAYNGHALNDCRRADGGEGTGLLCLLTSNPRRVSRPGHGVPPATSTTKMRTLSSFRLRGQHECLRVTPRSRNLSLPINACPAETPRIGTVKAGLRAAPRPPRRTPAMALRRAQNKQVNRLA